MKIPKKIKPIVAALGIGVSLMNSTASAETNAPITNAITEPWNMLAVSPNILVHLSQYKGHPRFQEYLRLIYQTGLNDKEGSREKFIFHTNFWKKEINSSEFQDMSIKWSKITDKEQQQYLQETANKYCEYNKELELGGFDKTLRFYTDDPVRNLSNGVYDSVNKYIFINFNMYKEHKKTLQDIIEAISHEFVHGDDFLNPTHMLYTQMIILNGELGHYRTPDKNGGVSNAERFQPVENMPYSVSLAVRENNFSIPSHYQGMTNLFFTENADKNIKPQLIHLLQKNTAEFLGAIREDGNISIKESIRISNPTTRPKDNGGPPKRIKPTKLAPTINSPRVF